jgi:hypothetical protein
MTFGESCRYLWRELGEGDEPVKQKPHRPLTRSMGLASVRVSFEKGFAVYAALLRILPKWLSSV